MTEMMQFQGSDDTALILFGVTEQNGYLSAEAFCTNKPLEKKQLFTHEGNNYTLLSSIELADFLFCKNVTTAQAFTLLRRKRGKRKSTTQH